MWLKFRKALATSHVLPRQQNFSYLDRLAQFWDSCHYTQTACRCITSIEVPAEGSLCSLSLSPYYTPQPVIRVYLIMLCTPLLASTEFIACEKELDKVIS